MDYESLKLAIKKSVGDTNVPIHAVSVPVVWSNMPASVRELFGTITGRQCFDLSKFNYCRIMVNVGSVAPVANAKMKIQWSASVGGTYADICSVTMPATANLLNVGTWTEIPDGAKIVNCFLRCVGIDGDGAVDPSFGGINLQLK